MKVLLKSVQCIGFVLLGIGGGAMDSTSIVIPMIMAFVGLGMTIAGLKMEEMIYG